MLFDKECSIGRSVMKCLLIETEDDIKIDNEYSEENLRLTLRATRLFFDAMDRMGIRRVRIEVFSHLMSFGYEGEFLEQILNDDEVQIQEFCDGLEHWDFCHPEYFDYGEPELEVQCDESCRGSAELLEHEYYEGAVSSMVVYRRPENCLYKDNL